MTSDNCTCPLTDYQMIVVDNGKPTDTMTNIAKGLGYSIRGRKNEPELAKVARAYPSRFISRAGISGHELVKWSNYLHQQGLVEMTHRFLCTDGNGPRFWPDGYDDDRLRYSEDRDEIFEEMFRFFFTVNQYQKPKKPRLKRSRRDLEDHEQLLNTGSVDGQPPTREDPIRAEMPQRPTKSPDHFDESFRHQSIPPNNPRRFVNQRRVHHGNVVFNASPAGGQGRASVGPYPRGQETTHGLDVLAERPRDPGNATMTDAPAQPNVEMDNTTHNGIDNGPPQPMNTDRASDAPRGPEDQEGVAYDNRAFWPSSGQSREVPQSRQGLLRCSPEPDAQPAEEPASPRPEPKTNPTPAPAVIHGVHLIISVQTFPWLNEIWHPNRYLFRYTLKTLFEELPWQGELYRVIMVLEFPGGVVVEEVQRDDEMSFRIVLARFEQKIETLRMCYDAPDRDVILEVSLEPMGRYQEPSERVRALLKRHMR